MAQICLPPLQPTNTIQTASQTMQAAAVAGRLSWKWWRSCCLHSSCQKETSTAALELLIPG